MEIIEALAYIIGFFALYGVAVVIAWLIDTGLRKVFGKGIVPKGYWS